MCLSNLIGIRQGCGLPTPDSSLFINDLKGLSIKVVEAGVNEETESGIALIQEKIDFAKERILQDLRTFLQPKMRVRSIINQDTVGRYNDNLEPIALEAAKFKGVLVEIDKCDYLSFHLASVRLKLDAALTTNILVIDLMTGLTLDTLPITTVADAHTELIINKVYPVKQQRLQLFIGIDSSVAGTFDTRLNECHTCSTFYRREMALFSAVEILQASQKIKDNTVKLTHTNGLSINYSVKCDIEPFVCNIADSLAWPMLHLIGAELMGELKVSERLNTTVVIHADNIEALEEQFMTTYSDSMNQLLDNLSIPEDSFCLLSVSNNNRSL